MVPARPATPARSPRPTPAFAVARIYELDQSRRGRAFVVLVDRLWPRGITTADAGLDEWAKDVAPSTALRRWYGHEPERFDEFARRYRHELREEPARDVAARLVATARQRPVLLVTATRAVERSGARVLRDSLRRRLRS